MRKEDKGGGIMERLTIDEVIEHCSKTCDMTEKIAKARGHELESIESNQFWEHYQVRNWLNELKQYKDLEEQGLLLRLPCPIGTTVYNTTWWDDVTEKVDVDGKTFYRTVPKHKVSKSTFSLVDIYDFGKTVFLTQAEAEQKLKEMESD